MKDKTIVMCQFCGRRQEIDEILLGKEIPCPRCYKFFEAGGKPIVKAKPKKSGKTLSTRKSESLESKESFGSWEIPTILAKVFKDEMAEMPTMPGYPRYESV